MTLNSSGAWRKTTQFLMPARQELTRTGQYGIYPAYSLESGQIFSGFEQIARIIASTNKNIIIDGYPGVMWALFQRQLQNALEQLGIDAYFQFVEDCFLHSAEIDRLIAPFFGGNDPLFGFRFPGSLSEFFDHERLLDLRADSASVNILYGSGADLAGWDGLLFYVDVPKNEIQFRARSKSVKNLGASEALEAKAAYKRSYFIDWNAANRHKADLLSRIDWIIDEQRPEQPVLMSGESLRNGLRRMSRSFLRARPWFEPGPWGGQWIKGHIPQLNNEAPNYAWSFELITPENGLCFESDGILLEVSFDMLMFQEHEAVLGECAANFKYEFPIRYDFLDTIDGGNLSVQCHPRTEYIRKHFGETFTQDECYYILDCLPDAQVYLGFDGGIDKEKFKDDLIRASETGERIDMLQYVQALPAKKHDLFLIPNGTIHGAGAGNMVLEISATPYIFTFKMYDWQRLDLDGKPRQLNIDRAFENLYFDRKGESVPQEFISQPKLLRQGNDWRIVHLPCHPVHFYDVHRYEFSGVVEIETGGLTGSCHILSLVEGQTVLLQMGDGSQTRFNYAETFVVPAASERYRLFSESGDFIKVVVTFIKPRDQWIDGVVPNA